MPVALLSRETGQISKVTLGQMRMLPSVKIYTLVTNGSRNMTILKALGLADSENGNRIEMQELKPLTTLGPAKKAFDNGGRFYSFFDAADDELVSRGPLRGCVCPFEKETRPRRTRSIRWSSQRAKEQH